MTTIKITRSAKCSDCKFIESVYQGKRKTHKCNNESSPYYNSHVTLKDLVCDNWKI